jgi:hypothetical protein
LEKSKGPSRKGQSPRTSKTVIHIRLFAFFLLHFANKMSLPVPSEQFLPFHPNLLNYIENCYIKYNVPEIMQNEKRAHRDSVSNQFLTAQAFGS